MLKKPPGTAEVFTARRAQKVQINWHNNIFARCYSAKTSAERPFNTKCAVGLNSTKRKRENHTLTYMVVSDDMSIMLRDLYN